MNSARRIPDIDYWKVLEGHGVQARYTESLTSTYPLEVSMDIYMCSARVFFGTEGFQRFEHISQTSRFRACIVQVVYMSDPSNTNG